MCATTARPTPVRWRGLCAIAVSACAATTAIAVASPPAPWRVGATVVVFLAAGIGMMPCLATQRVALDLAGWCECAKSTVTVRIVDTGEGTWRERERDDKAAERCGAAAASAR